MSTGAGWDAGQLAQLLDLAVRAARAAGEELLRRYGGARLVDLKSSATDPVSDADRASEALIQQIVLGERPHDGMIGEEGAQEPSSSGLTWVVDPLDGTVNYLYQLGTWSVSVAAEDEQGAVVGVVCEPLANRCFTAIRGGGAWLDGRRIMVNHPVPLREALVATGFSYRAEVRARQGELVRMLLPRVRDIRRMGSAALDVCFVAVGMADAFVQDDLNRWDWAAAALVAREAGGVVTEVSLSGGGPGLLVAGPGLHQQLHDLLAGLAS